MFVMQVIPGNADVDIYTIMERCAFNEEQDQELKKYVEDKGLIYMCTPFSRAAADRLELEYMSVHRRSP